MNRKRLGRIRTKRAAGYGLFVGMFICLAGCTDPVTPPDITATPVPTLTSGAVPTPEPTDAPTSPVPQITEEPAGVPTPTTVVTPTDPVVPTNTPEPTDTPAALPASPTPKPTNTPVAEPTEVPEVPVTATPVPEPTVAPEYETLLQNGWQRTEDFFGYREIFFSGKFDVTQLYAVPGRYEYRYTASSDVGITFSVIGEELPVQPFLEELAAISGCLTEQEGESDYRYVYVENEVTVQGRIYACGNGEAENRMRIEFRSIAKPENATEGYGFYLR